VLLPPNILAVLFDLDGTLTDRPRSIAKVAARFVLEFADHLGPCDAGSVYEWMLEADENGYRPRHQFVTLLRKQLPWVRRPSAEQLLCFWQRECPLCTVESKGATPTLRHLRQQGMRLGVVSNGTTLAQNTKIDQLGLRPLLDAVVISETAGVKKPDRRIFEMALAQLNLPPQAVAFVGDHPVNDVLAAEAAGMTAIWLRGTLGWPMDVPMPKIAIKLLEEFTTQ